MGIGGSARGCLGPEEFWRPLCIPVLEKQLGGSDREQDPLLCRATD